MSREDWEIYEQMREERKQKRRQTLEETRDRIGEVRSVCSTARLVLSVPVETHWLIRRADGQAVAQYWPSVQKLQKLPNGKVSKQISVDGLVERITRGSIR